MRRNGRATLVHRDRAAAPGVGHRAALAGVDLVPRIALVSQEGVPRPRFAWCTMTLSRVILPDHFWSMIEWCNTMLYMYVNENGTRLNDSSAFV